MEMTMNRCWIIFSMVFLNLLDSEAFKGNLLGYPKIQTNVQRYHKGTLRSEYPKISNECKNMENEKLLITGCQLQGRAGIKDAKCKWPGGVVPYQFYNGPVKKFVYNITEKRIIYKAFTQISSKTRVRFVPKNRNHKDFVTIKRGGALSWIGKRGGEQISQFGSSNCISEYSVLHETMHLLGFLHEQSRPDRDSYIKVYRGNIIKGFESDFDICFQTDTYGHPYDYWSITHYPEDAFANQDGKLTMRTLDPKYQHIIGTGRKLTQWDIEKIRKMYP